jgi:hypothetical protein
MKLLDFVNNNHQFLQFMHRTGLLSHTIFFYRNLVNEYEKNVIMGMSKTDSVIYTADRFGSCDRTVYRAIKVMNNEMPEDVITDKSAS